MKTKSKLLTGSGGFSLVELLVVIAVIAIIAAIAIPNIANITGSANIAKNQRNAQSVASVAAAARAAGYTNNWLSGTGAAGTLATGVTVTNGSNVQSFSLSAISTNDLPGIVQYLTVSTPPGAPSDQVNYVPSGT